MLKKGFQPLFMLNTITPTKRFFLIFSQAACQDAGHGSRSGGFHLWNGRLLPVPGLKLPRGHAHAAEHAELHASVRHLHQPAALQDRYRPGFKTPESQARGY